MLGPSIPKDGIHIVIVNASFGGRRKTLGSLSFGQGALVDLVLVEISQERFDSCSNTSSTLGNTPASVANPNVSVTFVSLLVSKGIHLVFDPFGERMKYSDDNVFRCLKGFRVPADNVKEEFATRAAVLDQTIECLVVADAMPAEIAPLVAFEWILTSEIGPGWLISIIPHGRKFDMLSNEGLPESSRLEGMHVGWVLFKFLPQARS